MAIPISTSRSHLFQAVTDSRAQSDDLQRQLATGLKAQTYGELGVDRRLVIEFSSDLSEIEGYIRSIEQVQVRVNVLSETLEHARSSVSETLTNSLTPDFDLNSDGQTLFQSESHARFHDLVAILDTEAGGRYIYSGREVTKKPVVPGDEILHGVGGLAGFHQVAQERELADLGADFKGRLAVTAPSATEVRISEDGVHPFGFKLTAVNSAITGTSTTGPAGSPGVLDLDVTANTAQDGQTLTIDMTLPDGTSRDLIITARTGTPTEPGEFQIGATATDTANNINAAINAELLRLGDTELKAASQFEAAENFFNFDSTNPPQRVDGPPFESATALVDATTANTVFWYQGELGNDDPRSSQAVKVDDFISVEYGARANEEAFQVALQNFAVASLDTYNAADVNSRVRYDAMRTRVSRNLSDKTNTQHVDHIIAEIASTDSVIGRTKERHQSHGNLLEQMVDKRRNADIYEVSAQLLDLQTRLQATYQTMATLQQISLVNFI